MGLGAERVVAQPAASRAATRQTLLAAIAPQAGGLTGPFGDVAAVDWDWLIERAESHRVAALVTARLDAAGIVDRLPDPIRARLDDVRCQAAQRAAAAQRTLRELAEALKNRNVPFLLIKGSILAEQVYRDPLIRPFYDVDVIVPDAALPAAEAVLESWRYRREGPWRLLGRRPEPPIAVEVAESIARRFYLRRFHNLSFAPARGDERRPVELHWTIVPRGRLRVRAEQLWTRTRAVQVAGIELRTLDAEATLIHLCVHALEAWFHSFRLLHLTDVAWTVADAGDRYRDLWQLADAWGAAYHVELALRLVDRFAAVPAARVLLAGRRPSPRLRLAQLLVARERVLVDRNIAPDDPWPRRAAIELAWGFAVGGLRSKLGFSLARRVAVARWRLALWNARRGFQEN
jgi:hypothetical protein